jgi:hypothetical protein
VHELKEPSCRRAKFKPSPHSGRANRFTFENSPEFQSAAVQAKDYLKLPIPFEPSKAPTISNLLHLLILTGFEVPFIKKKLG